MTKSYVNPKKWREAWMLPTMRALSNATMNPAGNAGKMMPVMVQAMSEWELSIRLGTNYVTLTASSDATTWSVREKQPRGRDLFVAQFPHHVEVTGELQRRFIETCAAATVRALEGAR